MRPGSLKYILLFLAQAVLWNYFNFSQYVLIAFLPAMILCLPVSRGTLEAMVIAFVTGVAIDFLVTGQLGLTAFALVPVALIRRGVISLVFGSELFARGEELSLQRQGWLKFVPAILLLTAAFLLPYIVLDDAGTRPFWFGAAKFGISLLLSSFVSVFVCDILLEDTAARWR